MKTAAELQKSTYSGQEHVRRTATLRRLATSLMAQARGEVDLCAKECKVLEDAAKLLRQMASVSAEAAKIKKQDAARQEAREAEARIGMTPTFGSMTSVPDQVALIAVVNRSEVTVAEGRVHLYRTWLPEAFERALRELAFDLARKERCPGKSLQAATEEAWANFLAMKASLQERHCMLISRLSEHDKPERLAPTGKH